MLFAYPCSDASPRLLTVPLRQSSPDLHGMSPSASPSRQHANYNQGIASALESVKQKGRKTHDFKRAVPLLFGRHQKGCSVCLNCCSGSERTPTQPSGCGSTYRPMRKRANAFRLGLQGPCPMPGFECVPTIYTTRQALRMCHARRRRLLSTARPPRPSNPRVAGSGMALTK